MVSEADVSGAVRKLKYARIRVSHMRMKAFTIIVILWIGLAASAGCVSTAAEEGSHDPTEFRIMIFAELPDWFEDVAEADIRKLLETENKNMDVQVDVMIPSYDKLTIEIINKEIDFFVVEKRLEQILLDPYGLAVLDGLEADVPEGVDYQEYVLYSEDSESEHLYAIPFDETSGLFRDTGIMLEEPLAASIVETSPHRQTAKKLLKYWLSP